MAVVSASADHLRDALSELRRLKRRDLLGPGVQLVELPTDFVSWATSLIENRPVFVRHVCPVHTTALLSSDLDSFRAAVHGLVERFVPHEAFAAQVQLVGESSSAGRHRLREAAHEVVTGEVDLPVSVPEPVQVLSIVVASDRAYLGVSRAEHNLSNWPGGMRRFAREPGQVSRSEFKLLEALEAFGIEIGPGIHALDLGASPGGWSRVLAERGARVVAVDPAEMHDDIATDPRVLHHRVRVQDLHKVRGLPAFRFVANDMRMDARDSARAMGAIRPLLADRGDAVMTLKLPSRKAVPTLRAATGILREGLAVAGVRQLFHNRHEVTVHLKWPRS